MPPQATERQAAESTPQLYAGQAFSGGVTVNPLLADTQQFVGALHAEQGAIIAQSRLNVDPKCAIGYLGDVVWLTQKLLRSQIARIANRVRSVVDRSPLDRRSAASERVREA